MCLAAGLRGCWVGWGSPPRPHSLRCLQRAEPQGSTAGLGGLISGEAAPASVVDWWPPVLAVGPQPPAPSSSPLLLPWPSQQDSGRGRGASVAAHQPGPENVTVRVELDCPPRLPGVQVHEQGPPLVCWRPEYQAVPRASSLCPSCQSDPPASLTLLTSVCQPLPDWCGRAPA